MTQTLDVGEQTAQLDGSQTIGGPAVGISTSATAAVSKFWTFAITFAIAFALLYTVFVKLNWPLLTYYPAVGKLYFWMYRAGIGENLGPPMYWYGWLSLALPGAAVLGWIATMLSPQSLYRATIFACVLAALWSSLFAIGVYIADQVNFDAEFLKSLWVSAIPAFAGAAAAGYFISAKWAERVSLNLLLIVPLGAIVVLAYSLKGTFLR